MSLNRQRLGRLIDQFPAYRAWCASHLRLRDERLSVIQAAVDNLVSARRAFAPHDEFDREIVRYVAQELGIDLDDVTRAA
jgi:hypothetical protein